MGSTYQTSDFDEMDKPEEAIQLLKQQEMAEPSSEGKWKAQSESDYRC